MMCIPEAVEKQSRIIKMQADIISDLFLELLQYKTVEEFDERQLATMQESAKLTREIS